MPTQRKRNLRPRWVKFSEIHWFFNQKSTSIRMEPRTMLHPAMRPLARSSMRRYR